MPYREKVMSARLFLTDYHVLRTRDGETTAGFKIDQDTKWKIAEVLVELMLSYRVTIFNRDMSDYMSPVALIAMKSIADDIKGIWRNDNLEEIVIDRQHSNLRTKECALCCSLFWMLLVHSDSFQIGYCNAERAAVVGFHDDEVFIDAYENQHRHELMNALKLPSSLASSWVMRANEEFQEFDISRNSIP